MSTAWTGVLDPAQKTIIHIPHRGSSEAFDDKNNEVGKIMDFLGRHVGAGSGYWIRFDRAARWTSSESSRPRG